MALWTDIIDPATLTGYARAAFADYEARKGTLARWLPNREIADIIARFVAGQNGLIEVAEFRAYDAEIEIGTREGGKRVVIELPALGRNFPVSEYEQLRARSGSVSPDLALLSIQKVTTAAVRAVSDAIEAMRGVVLATGKATINQDRYKTEDDFGRDAAMAPTATTLWSAAGAKPMVDIRTWVDAYGDANGVDPGVIVVGRRAYNALASDPSLQTILAGGATRRPTADELGSLLAGDSLPPLVRYDRRVKQGGVTKVALADDRIYLLPAPVAVDDWQGTELGGTFWGRTLSSTEPGWGIEEADQPGIVAGVWRNDKPPMGIEVIADAIGLPVLANANLAMAAKVL